MINASVYKQFTTQIDSKYKDPEYQHMKGVIEIMQGKHGAEKAFQETAKKMEQIEEVIIDTYYDKFNVATQHYASCLDSIKSAENKLNFINDTVVNSESLLQNRATQIRNAYRNSLKYSYMAQLLNQIEEVYYFPQKYAKLLKNGYYLDAANALENAYNQVTLTQLKSIEALNQLTSRIIKEKENGFHKMIVSLLHSVIYLKESDTEKVFICIQDDGKEGFIRIDSDNQYTVGKIDTNKYSRIANVDFNTTNTVQDSSKIRENVITQLVECLFVVNRVKQANTEMMNATSDEIGLMMVNSIENSIKQKKSNLNEEESKREEGLSFYKILSSLSKSIKSVLINHKMVCKAFRKKLTGFQTGELPSIKSMEDLNLTYDMDFVWEKYQQEIQKLLWSHIKPTENICTSNSDIKGKLFSFSNSKKFISYKSVKIERNYSDYDFGILPSPYNLTPIYLKVIRLIEKAIFIVEPSDRTHCEDLKKYLEDFFIHTFLPFISMDYKKRRVSIIQAVDAWLTPLDRRRGLWSDDEKRPILSSTIEIFKCVTELSFHMKHMANLNSHKNSIITICHEILRNYVDVYGKKIKDLLQGTETGKIVEEEILKLDPASKKLLNQTSFLSSQDEMEEQLEFERNERDLEEPLYQGFFLTTKIRMESEPHKLLLKDKNNQPVNQEQKNMRNSHLNSIGLLSNIHDSLIWIQSAINSLESKEKTLIKDKKKIDPNTNAAPISQFLSPYLKQIEFLSAKTLLALRVELRLWAFYYMDRYRKAKLIGNSNADQFVTDLNLHLSATEETLKTSLPEKKVQYLFQSLPALVKTLKK